MVTSVDGGQPASCVSSFAGQSDKKISDRAPAAYRHDSGTAQFAVQQITVEDGLDAPGAFGQITKNRRAAIARRLNEFLRLTEGA